MKCFKSSSFIQKYTKFLNACAFEYLVILILTIIIFQVTEKIDFSKNKCKCYTIYRFLVVFHYD